MVEVGSIQQTPHSEAEMEPLIAAQIAELQSFDELMRRDRTEIDRLRSETSQLRRESRSLEAETRAILARIKALTE